MQGIAKDLMQGLPRLRPILGAVSGLIHANTAFTLCTLHRQNDIANKHPSQFKCMHASPFLPAKIALNAALDCFECSRNSANARATASLLGPSCNCAESALDQPNSLLCTSQLRAFVSSSLRQLGNFALAGMLWNTQGSGPH